MKRICKRPIQIDALQVCFSVVKPYHYEQLKALEVGDDYRPYEYKLQRVEGRYYNNIYNIIVTDFDGIDYEFGQLKFNISNGNEDSNVHLDGTPKAWISLNNKTLYSYRFSYFDYIATTLGLELHNITKLDLCLDTSFNVSKSVWGYIRNKSVATILNGKRITDRDEDRPEISRILSGSLNKDKYMTLNVKQRNAIFDKLKGISVTSYDKEAEIRNVSDKKYILQHYNNPKHLYRTEVHLNKDNVSNYLSTHNIELTYWTFMNESLLEDMFFHFIGSVLRFQGVTWQEILGRV